jgi:hypothetical protein
MSLAAESAWPPSARPVRRAGAVPVEFVGLARRYRSKIAVAHSHAEPAAERLIEPYRPRSGFEPWPRLTMLERLSRRWRALPTGNRVPSASRYAAGKVEIADLWLTPARISLPTWADDELALCLTLRVIEIAPPDFSDTSLTVATVGLHALARRYERGVGRTDAAVLRDLLALGPGYLSTFREEVEAGADFAIPLPCGGIWIGAATELDGNPLLGVRTFVDGDAR